METMPQGRMLTIAEAAELLGVRPDTLRQQAGKKILRARKPGRDWLVSPAEVERYGREHMRRQVGG
jgi:excisionase family DNA binding protein